MNVCVDYLVRTHSRVETSIVAQTGGNWTQNGHITVEFAPSFALSPMREAWSWNSHLVNLTCRAESIPNATITWFFNGRNMENDFNVKISAFNGESTLTVRNPWHKDRLSLSNPLVCTNKLLLLHNYQSDAAPLFIS